MLHRLKGGGFSVRLKAGSVRLRRTPSRHLEVITKGVGFPDPLSGTLNIVP
jgi:hypothetical protein